MYEGRLKIRAHNYYLSVVRDAEPCKIFKRFHASIMQNNDKINVKILSYAVE